MTANEILIIDDAPYFRKAVKSFLERTYGELLEAASVEEALTALRDNPDLKVILLDLVLGDENGEEFLRLIKGDINKYRVIILTEHDKELAAEKARRYGVFNYLPKTLDTDFRHLTQSLRFSVAQAFKDIERVRLEEKNNTLISIQKMINQKIKDGNDVKENGKALNEILDLICKAVNNFVGAYTCHIRLFDLATDDFTLAGFHGRSDDIKEIFKGRRKKGAIFSGRVAITKEAETFPDLQNNDEFKEFKKNILKNSALRDQTKVYLDKIRSAYIAPITTYMFDDETDAVFNVSSDDLNYFSADKTKIVDEFVTQATIAITKAWQAKRKTESHADYKRANKVLENISKALEAANSIKEVYDIAIKGISDIVNPEAIRIFSFNKETKELDVVAEYVGKDSVRLPDSHPIAGLTGEVFKGSQPIRVPNLQDGKRTKLSDFPGYSEELGDKYRKYLPSGQTEHYLGVPMFIGREPVGVIELLNKKSAYYDANDDKKTWLLERGFSRDCENVLGTAATVIAVAGRNAELFEKLKRKISRLDTLKEVGRYTSTEMPLNELLDLVIEETAKDLEAEVCLLFLLDEGESKVVLEQSYGIPVEFLKTYYKLDEIAYELGVGVTGRVAQTGDSVLMRSKTDIPKGRYSPGIIDYLTETSGKGSGFESLMIVPIKAKGKILGAIKAINKKDGGEYDEEDLDFFKFFGNYVGIAIENTRHYKLTNEKLATAEKNAALSYMLRAVVHEINNTEALIPLNVQNIRRRFSQSNYDVKEMLDIIEDSAKQAVAFANSVGAFSASRIGNRKERDINKITDKALKQLEATVKNNKAYENVRVILNLSKDPLMRSVYETPMVQVFQNIVINAYQAMEKSQEKTLTISSYESSENGLVKIEFTDTGPGIKSEIIDKIFDPEYTTKKAKGTGIGLWLARTHLQSINADIVVESALQEGSSLKKGTRFTVEIPVDTAGLSEKDDEPTS